MINARQTAAQKEHTILAATHTYKWPTFLEMAKAIYYGTVKKYGYNSSEANDAFSNVYSFSGDKNKEQLLAEFKNELIDKGIDLNARCSKKVEKSAQLADLSSQVEEESLESKEKTDDKQGKGKKRKCSKDTIEPMKSAELNEVSDDKDIIFDNPTKKIKIVPIETSAGESNGITHNKDGRKAASLAISSAVALLEPASVLAKADSVSSVPAVMTEAKQILPYDSVAVSSSSFFPYVSYRPMASSISSYRPPKPYPAIPLLSQILYPKASFAPTSNENEKKQTIKY